MPRFSVVMPTYQRAETLGRAIASVRAQTFTDWELVVVDDGSTDRTREVLARISEPRMVVVHQENKGVAEARNTALRIVRGELICFLDSDDEWAEYHLALMAAFFDAHPDEQVAIDEMWEDFGNQHYVKHYDAPFGIFYPELGRKVRAELFLKPPPSDDPILRFYETRQPIGEWAKGVLEGRGFANVRHYRGRIFEMWRWGWLMALQPTVITRRVLEEVGLFDTSYRVACDFGWLADVSRRYPVNLLTVPGAFKHELAPGVAPLKESHLATGAGSLRFHQDVLRYFETLFLSRAPDDPELRALHGYRQYLVGRAALLQGQRVLAAQHLAQAVKTFPGANVRSLLWLSTLGPSDALAVRALKGALRAQMLSHRAIQRAQRAVMRMLAFGGLVDVNS
jgi:glycosyltransferase involved in cell wall biosynthesis